MLLRHYVGELKSALVTPVACLVAGLTLLFSTGPAEAGYYELVRHTGSGTLNGNPIEKGEYDPFENGDCTPTSGSYTFTDTYEYQWVPNGGDTVADPPVETVIVAMADVSWGGSPTGAWEQECSTQASAVAGETSLSASWYNTIDSQGDGQFYEATSGGGVLHKDGILSGANPVFEVTWSMSTTRSGYNPALQEPYWDYMTLSRQVPGGKYIAISSATVSSPPLTNPNTPMPLSVNGVWTTVPGCGTLRLEYWIKCYHKGSPGNYTTTPGWEGHPTNSPSGTWSATWNIAWSGYGEAGVVKAELYYDSTPLAFGPTWVRCTPLAKSYNTRTVVSP